MKKPSIFFTIFLLYQLNVNAQQMLYSVPKKIKFDGQNTTQNFSPIGNFHNSKLYFVRKNIQTSKNKKGDQNIFEGDLDLISGEMKNVEAVERFNSERNDAVVGVSSDKSKIYLLDSYNEHKGLAVALKKNGQFNKAISVLIPNLKINTLNYGFYVHPDEQTIIISYEGENSMGLEDLYISNFVNNSWTEPIHLGNEINTNGYEISPFLSKDKDTLYFSSNGQQNSFGGADIYYSIKNKNGSWSKPINMGPTFNTSSFDAYLIQHGKYYVWTSTKENNKADLFYTEILKPIKLSAYFEKSDVTTHNGSDGMIQLKKINGYPPYSFKWSNGIFAEDCFQLPAGNYRVEITDSLNQQFDTVITINQPPIYKENSVIKFPQIQYKFDSWELINDDVISSNDSLELIVKLLNEYPQMVIKLYSHTDCRGDEKRNLILSQNRSRACYKYLVEQKGIDPRRIIPIGFGESIPAIYKDELTGNDQVLTESYINQSKKDPKKMEFLHQLNRRTEGIVHRMNFSSSDPQPDTNYSEFLKLPK